MTTAGRACFLGLFLALCCTVPAIDAHGGQRLIGPGDDWSSIVSRIQPGDEIVLMPGEHLPSTLTSLRGTGRRPIVIRSFQKDQPAIIRADRYGLELKGVRHIVVQDLIITGATVAGVWVRPPTGEPDDSRWNANVTLKNVSILQTGPAGRKHAVRLERVENITIDKCRIEGWGGAAVDINDCENVTVSKCTMRGEEGFSQLVGIHSRGGTRHVRIADCTLTRPGSAGIITGGEVSIKARRRMPIGQAQASDVIIVRCIIADASCPLQFLGADDCQARNLTIVRPRQWVIAIDAAPTDPARIASRDLRFGSNLIIWEPGALSRLIQTGGAYRAGAMTMDANLWWVPGEEPNFTLPEMGSDQQVTSVDPEPDDLYKPTVAQASLFGAHAP